VLKKPELLSVDEYLAGEKHSDLRHEYLGGARAVVSRRRNTPVWQT
jgi:hypothetical protein